MSKSFNSKESIVAINLKEISDLNLLKMLRSSPMSNRAREEFLAELMQRAEKREKPVKLPTFEEAQEIEVATPLHYFIFHNEPVGIEEETKFRNQLQKAVEWAIQNGGL